MYTLAAVLMAVFGLVGGILILWRRWRYLTKPMSKKDRNLEFLRSGYGVLGCVIDVIVGLWFLLIGLYAVFLALQSILPR